MLRIVWLILLIQLIISIGEEVFDTTDEPYGESYVCDVISKN